jgi:hypothetical protein
MPVALIANRLGVDHATFKAWTARLDAAVEPDEPASNFQQRDNTNPTKRPISLRRTDNRVASTVCVALKPHGAGQFVPSRCAPLSSRNPFQKEIVEE